MLRHHDPLWQVKARDEKRLRKAKGDAKLGRSTLLTRAEAMRAWGRILDALAASELAEDRRLAGEIRGFVQRQPITQFAAQIQRQQREHERQPQQEFVRAQAFTPQPEKRPSNRDLSPSRGRDGPDGAGSFR